ncbi:hypothetical protein ACFLXU_06065 [Chloroflexota bacterium]
MDKEVLIKWKSELETNLANLEKRLSELELERWKIREQLGAVATLLSTTDGGGITKQGGSITLLTESDAIAGFFSSLKGQGWSIAHKGGRLSRYIASRGDQRTNLWIKFSMYHEAVDSYWFGIGPEHLESLTNENGGVILLLGTSNRYICFPFAKLRELLRGATKAKTGQKFKVWERGEQVRLLPAGTGEWTDITRFYGTQGLQEISLRD